MGGHSLDTIEFGSGNVNRFDDNMERNPLFEDYTRAADGSPIGLRDLTPDIIADIKERARARQTIVASWISPDYPGLIAQQQKLQDLDGPSSPLTNKQVTDEEVINGSYALAAHGFGKITIPELVKQIHECWPTIDSHADRMEEQRRRRKELGIPPIPRRADKLRAAAPPKIQDYEPWDGFSVEPPERSFGSFCFGEVDVTSITGNLAAAYDNMNADTEVMRFFFPEEEPADGGIATNQLGEQDQITEQLAAPEAIPVMGSPITIDGGSDSQYFGIPRELVDNALAVTMPLPKLGKEPVDTTGAHDFSAEWTTDSLPVINEGSEHDVPAPAAETEAEVSEYAADVDAEATESVQPQRRRWWHRIFRGRRAAKTALREVVEIDEGPDNEMDNLDPVAETTNGAGTPVQGIDPDTVVTTPFDVPREYINTNQVQMGTGFHPLIAEAGQQLEADQQASKQ